MPHILLVFPLLQCAESCSRGTDGEVGMGSPTRQGEDGGVLGRGVGGLVLLVCQHLHT